MIDAVAVVAVAGLAGSPLPLATGATTPVGFGGVRSPVARAINACKMLVAG